MRIQTLNLFRVSTGLMEQLISLASFTDLISLSADPTFAQALITG